MPAPPLVREAVSEDAGVISALIHSLAPYFLADPEDPEAAEGFFRTVTPEAIADYLASDRFRYHVAVVDGAVVGAVGVRDHAHLFHLFVAEAFHGRGIAGRLWSVARAAALAAGSRGTFTVNSSLHAVPVYERLGFVAGGEVVRQDGIRFLPMELRPEPRPHAGGAWIRPR